MHGIIKKKNLLWSLILSISGFVICVIFFMVFCSEDTLSSNDILIGSFFIFYGLINVFLGVWSISVECRSFITVNADGIKAYASYFFTGRKIAVDYGDVISVSLGYLDSLIVKCTCSSDDFQIMNLQNRAEIMQYISKRICYRRPNLNKDDLILQVMKLSDLKKRKTGSVILCAILLGAITVCGFFLTAQYANCVHKGIVLFAIILLFVLFVLILVFFCIQLVQILKFTNQIEHTEEELTQLILRHDIPAPGRAVSMYLDNRSHATVRYVIYRLHDSDEVFYIMEAVNRSYELEVIYESTLYESIDYVPLNLSVLEKIPVPHEQ